MGRLPASGIVFGVFMTESIFRYCKGKTGEGETFNLQLPLPGKLSGIAALTVALVPTGGVLVGAMQRRLGSK